MKRRTSRTALAVGLLGFSALASLTLMGLATQASGSFGPLYTVLLVINAVGLITLLVLIGYNLYGLVQQLKRRAPGARLSLRMVALFSALSVLPVLVVYVFSLSFLTRGIDSWFNVDTDSALGSALELSRTALELRMREVLRQTERVAESLSDSSEPMMAIDLSALRGKTTIVANTPDPGLELDLRRRETEAEELLLLSEHGQIRAFSSATSTLVPNTPSEALLLQVRQGRGSVSLDPIGNDGELYIRALVTVPGALSGQERLLLQALYAVPTRINRLAEEVQSAYARNSSLGFLRDQLKLSFSMTLTLVLLFSVFAALWAAFYSARQLSEPIRDLAEGTRAVAAGDYSTMLPVMTRDDMGFLVESFNEMTRRLASARDEARASRSEVEQERGYLTVLLGRLSSGVISVDGDGRIRTVNASAAQILGLEQATLQGQTLESLATRAPQLEAFLQLLGPVEQVSEWQREVEVFGTSGRQVLMVRGAPLHALVDQPQGAVVVFDDITLLIQGQRNAAWSEVARRLAHEIKNPLTPIQLSAERLRHKYLRSLTGSDSETFDRLTATIVAQVETMKSMVNAFSDYARAPRLQPQPLDLRALVEEVLDLFRAAHPEASLTLEAAPGRHSLQADPGRLRQVFNNLVKNAIEAASDGQPRVVVRIEHRLEAGAPVLQIAIDDNGGGVPGELLPNLFEPYVTTKHKGTGLGLAIVKKAVEEHGGVVWAENRSEGGARIVIRLPADESLVDTSAVETGSHA
jgi:PAS domain S-box-containing protein